jgi:hypothetical protein
MKRTKHTMAAWRPGGIWNRAAKLGAQTALILIAEAHSRPEHLLGVLSILFNVLMIDRLVCSEPPYVHDNGVMMAALAARLLGLIRAAGQPPRSSQPELVTDCASAGLALFCVHHGGARLAAARFAPLWLFFICLVASASGYAAFEPPEMYSARVVAFTLLALLLPAERLGPRGYLLFAPVLLAQWWVAWVFASLAVWQLTAHEWCCQRRPEARPLVYMPLATET